MDDQEIQLRELDKEESITGSLPLVDSTSDVPMFRSKTVGNLSKEVQKAFNMHRGYVREPEVQLWLQDNPGDLDATNDNGMTVLHLAALLNSVEIVLKMLTAGADPNLLDSNGRSPLHLVCSLTEDDVTGSVSLLLSKSLPVLNVKDDKANTPLLCAAANGHLEAVKMILEKGADLKAVDNNGDTPIHRAASAGHAQIVKHMILKSPECVNLRGYNEETPLHQAAEGGHMMTVQEILNGNPNVNASSKIHETPLHSVASSGSAQTAKLLLENGAVVDPPVPKESTTLYRSPFHKAAYYGCSEVVDLLLKKGAVVTADAFEEIVQEGYEGIAAEVIKTPQWPVALRKTYTNNGKETTPFRELIRKMPDVAEDILNKCTVENPDVTEHGDDYYSVVYNYEFIEDFLDGHWAVRDGDYDRYLYPGDYVLRPDSGPKKKKNLMKEKEVDTFGCGFNDITRRIPQMVIPWGPAGFNKFYHPLALMQMVSYCKAPDEWGELVPSKIFNPSFLTLKVRHKRLNLLNHPVIGSLLHYKWKKFGQYGYFINLFSYLIFLIFLTSFALVVPSPQEDVCQFSNSSINMENSTTCTGIGDNRRNFLYLAPAIIILFALCRLLVEFGQLVTLRVYYLIDWINWMEIGLFVCSIIFVWVYNTECQCVLSWQWQVGVVAVFLGWIDLIVFISKFPLTGIYVLMFVKILYTFLKMLVLTLLLIIAFGLTFFMIFFDPSAKRSPFSDAPRSLLKTMTMTTGELDYDAIFRLDPAGGSDDAMELEYLPISYILWILFIVLMPILLTNMLVGLAVGDIGAIQKEAELQKLALQVEQVLTVEELMPRRLRNRYRTKYLEVYPNQKFSKLTRAGFVLWDGDRYDNYEVINKALHPPKDPNEEILEKTNSLARDIDEVKQVLHQFQDPNEEILEKTNSLARNVDEVKQVLLRYQFLVEEIAKKNGIDIPQKF